MKQSLKNQGELYSYSSCEVRFMNYLKCWALAVFSLQLSKLRVVYHCNRIYLLHVMASFVSCISSIYL